MKQKISYSSVISGVSIAIIIAFVAIFVLLWVFIDKPFDDVFFWILIGLFCLFFCWIIGTSPEYVSADDNYLGVKKAFNTKRYNISDIKSIEAYDKDNYPSDVEKGVRLYGKFKNPIVITLKNGKKFVVGSEDSKQFVDYVNKRIS